MLETIHRIRPSINTVIHIEENLGSLLLLLDTRHKFQTLQADPYLLVYKMGVLPQLIVAFFAMNVMTYL
jgi:hypothetical protein